VHQLEIKVLNIIDARCNHEVCLNTTFIFKLREPLCGTRELEYMQCMHRIKCRVRLRVS